MDQTKRRGLVESNTILRVVVGSQAYGISSGTSSDRDEKGVCIEPFEWAMGLSTFEQLEFRSAVERTGQKDAPSGPGDLDLTIYSLRKFLKLALKGNPTILEMFFIKKLEKGTNVLGEKLQELAPYIVCRKAGNAYLGYMQAQKRKLQDKESVPGSERASLVEKYGFDTKYAGHLLRLGMQGVELLTTGKIVLPIDPVNQTLIRSVREGHWPLDHVLESAKELEEQLKHLIDHSTILSEPNVEVVEDWMIDTYWRWWRAQRIMLDLPVNSVVQ